jgi:predicted nucleic-acid-binding Zn-ribbon protein
MGLFERAPYVATVNGQVFRCLVCQGGHFSKRSIRLNTAAMEFFDLAWANRSSLGVICDNCGYVHEFVGGAIQLWDSESGLALVPRRRSAEPAGPRQ